MIEPTEYWFGEQLRILDQRQRRPRRFNRRLSSERLMGTDVVVILDILGEHALQVPLERDDVVEQLPSDDAYETLANAVLPRAVGRNAL